MGKGALPTLSPGYLNFLQAFEPCWGAQNLLGPRLICEPTNKTGWLSIPCSEKASWCERALPADQARVSSLDFFVKMFVKRRRFWFWLWKPGGGAVVPGFRKQAPLEEERSPRWNRMDNAEMDPCRQDGSTRTRLATLLTTVLQLHPCLGSCV